MFGGGTHGGENVAAIVLLHLLLQVKAESPDPATDGPPSNMPIWHNIFFQNSKGLSYYSPQLVLKRVLVLSHIEDGGGGVGGGAFTFFTDRTGVGIGGVA